MSDSDDSSSIPDQSSVYTGSSTSSSDSNNTSSAGNRFCDQGIAHVGLTPGEWNSTGRPSSGDARLLATGRPPDLGAQSATSYSGTSIQQGRYPFASLGPFPGATSANSPLIPPARSVVHNEEREAAPLPPERTGSYPAVRSLVVLAVLLYLVRRVLGEGIIDD